MAFIQTSADEFVGENVLTFIDEGHAVQNIDTDTSCSIGGAAEALAAAINAVCADGVHLTSIERMCGAIRELISLVEVSAYISGAAAQRDGRDQVTTRTADKGVCHLTTPPPNTKNTNAAYLLTQKKGHKLETRNHRTDNQNHQDRMRKLH